MKSSKPKAPNETSIQNAILTYLSYRRDVFVWRNNTTGIYDAKRGRYRSTGKFSIKGVADILGVTNEGQIICLEVKRPGGRTSRDQQNFLSRVKTFGGIAGVVTSVQEVIELFEKERPDEAKRLPRSLPS
tara:strand:+ start:3160 stop:3549 length:390 start_codon:yes stop_codon:yes gene_type:complete